MSWSVCVCVSYKCRKGAWVTSRTNFNNMFVCPGPGHRSDHTACWWARFHDNAIDSEARRWGDVEGVWVFVWGDTGLKGCGVKERDCRAVAAFVRRDLEFYTIRPIYHQQHAAHITAAPICTTVTTSSSWIMRICCLSESPVRANWIDLDFGVYENKWKQRS